MRPASFFAVSGVGISTKSERFSAVASVPTSRWERRTTWYCCADFLSMNGFFFTMSAALEGYDLEEKKKSLAISGYGPIQPMNRVSFYPPLSQAGHSCSQVIE
mmetsp:Transcript_10398/g.24252  ORF Transcript_10398/g.24252 Transcript_10398/m.24252 type:complete len:103 (-) Transcript_10398:15-323(-)